MKVPELWPENAGTRRVAMIAGLLIAIAIIAAVVWVIATYPRDRRQPPPQPPVRTPAVLMRTPPG